jgi:hypothetical protein
LFATQCSCEAGWAPASGVCQAKQALPWLGTRKRSPEYSLSSPPPPPRVVALLCPPAHARPRVYVLRPVIPSIVFGAFVLLCGVFLGVVHLMRKAKGGQGPNPLPSSTLMADRVAVVDMAPLTVRRPPPPPLGISVWACGR